MNSPLLDKSLDFATQIVLFYEAFCKTKKDTTIAKQLLRSATSIGANINEAVYGNSKADFVSKLHIALKETGALSRTWTTWAVPSGLQARTRTSCSNFRSPPRRWKPQSGSR